MPRTIYPKNYIEEVLMGEIKDISATHPYLSFFLICAGIEFLGICLDDASAWFDEGKSKSHFKNAVEQLFPTHYYPLKDSLYSNLRCGLLHCSLPRGCSLTELKNNPQLKYEEHLIKDNQVIVIDYFYQDFVDACQKVMDMTFPVSSKMNQSLLVVG